MTPTDDLRPSAPLFTIITVTYNAADVVERTMRSVAEQTCRLYEHLIIDGASTDATLKIVADCATELTTVRSEPDHGIYDAMNRGLALSHGEYYIFLNAGDAFHSPTTLQTIADTIMDNDFPGVVYGETDIVDASGQRLGCRHLQAPEHLTLDSFKEGMSVCLQAFIAFNRITGPYNLRYRYSADYDWTIRCLQHSRSNIKIDDVIIDYLYEGATTRHRFRSLWERFRIMAYYYGTLPTLWRHLRFIPRYLRRRRVEKSFKQ